jgi:SanA protein
MKTRTKYGSLFLIFLVLITSLTIWANIEVTKESGPFVTDNIENVGSFKAGLLLGTSKNLKNGARNDFFFNRINATVELFKRGKIQYIIISGDNSRDNYNEPFDMELELIKRGISIDKIFLDYAGFRTFDSVIRAKEIFGQTSYLIISQKFHNERAVYIARRNGINAFGYNANDVLAFKGFKTKLRELFARDKMFLDLLLHVRPKYLGDQISVK